MAAWQWVYVIIGLFGLFIAALIYLFLPDFPDSPPSSRQFLTPEEGSFLVARLPPHQARSGDLNFDWPTIKKEIRSPLLYAFAAAQFFANAATTGVSFWLPTLIAGFGLTTTASSQLLNIPPAALYIIFALSIAWIADNDTRVPKPLYMITGMIVLSLFYVGLMLCTDKGGLYALIMLAYIPVAAYGVTLYPMRAATVTNASSASFALAFMNACGQLPSLFAAQIFRSEFAPRYIPAFGICIGFAIFQLSPLGYLGICLAM